MTTKSVVRMPHQFLDAIPRLSDNCRALPRTDTVAIIVALVTAQQSHIFQKHTVKVRQPRITDMR